MDATNYHDQVDINNELKLRELRMKLPRFCGEFFRGIEPTTSSRTRIAYGYDLVVFFIAMFTMKVTGISTKYNKFSHLLGGIIMVVIGLLLLFKPEWLMFNFK